MHTQTTIIGNLVDDPTYVRFDNSDEDPGHKVSMRVAASRRRLRQVNGKEEWQDADQLFISVECWGELALNVKRSLRKGHPVVCLGHLITQSWGEGEGRRSAIVLRANHVAFELSRYLVGSKRTDAQEHVPDKDLTFADVAEPDRVIESNRKQELAAAPF
ncbi:single-stranded DNA-binding protein [Corynebacterium pseudopelargi]|uniref:Single-stranded DNA-binding protein n=1 Tax=Corynebacterium pseudopelargi TaxID=2080757 RepID=A0A3G6IVH3_9CORY|nr:single-stranded DNA-binding protein [Corynebacterium pseudopelargi]AZA08648.1 Single-stranded DNA-binding protein 2 [Corynebacterium pseudopelargi]